MKTEMRAVQLTRELGGDLTEQLDAFREARKDRRMLEVELDLIFAQRGWK